MRPAICADAYSALTKKQAKSPRGTFCGSARALLYRVIRGSLPAVLLFPVGAPLFCSLFVGIAVREAGIQAFIRLIDQVFLYGGTFFLGLILGLLCSARTLLDEKVLILLVLGIFALTMSAIGGIIGGYIMYLLTGRRFNPVCGIAGISCVPTCAKIAQKEISRVAPDVIVLPDAL